MRACILQDTPACIDWGGALLTSRRCPTSMVTPVGMDEVRRVLSAPKTEYVGRLVDMPSGFAPCHCRCVEQGIYGGGWGRRSASCTTRERLESPEIQG
jgi:hypothetical protein